jgi:[ribosomal protein S18]-alanine N-acetyltransferase
MSGARLQITTAAGRRPTRKEAIMTSGQKQDVRVHIRWMIRRDMPEILAIEAQSFEFPWSEEDFINCLRQRNCIGMVAEHDDHVVGFMIYELNKTRIQVLNFAVGERYRRRGVGTQMMAKLIGKLSSQRRSRITLEVRETNLPAQLFFRAGGFRAVSVLREFYADTPEDAYLMQYRYRQQGQEILIPANRITRLAG